MEVPLQFTIVAPRYTPSSNGVVLVYKLGGMLESLGHQVQFVPKEKAVFEKFRETYAEDILRKFVPDASQARPESIAIIPETTPEDVIAALPCRRRVFYLLNRPYMLTGRPLAYRPEDLVVAYSGLVSKAHFNLFITSEIRDFERIENRCREQPSKENLVLFYFGKSRHAVISDPVARLLKKNRSKVVVINRTFPKSRDVLFDLLRRARLLVSYDPLTNLNYEATLCRTPTFIADNYMKLRYTDHNHPLTGFVEDPAELESRYADGITAKEHDTIIADYRATLAGNHRNVVAFIKTCRDWFTFAEEAAGNPARTEFLHSHNRLRHELDYAAFQVSGGQLVHHAFDDYTAEMIAATTTQRVLGFLAHRKDRLFWNARRNWQKHIVGLKGDALTAKLEQMRDAYELRKLGCQHLNRPSTNP